MEPMKCGKMIKHPRQKTGFTLIELVVTMVIIGILAGAAIPSYVRFVEKEGRSAEAREVLNKAYAGLRKYIMDELPLGGGNPISWGKLGMSDPNANAARFFNYNILPNFTNPARIRAERIGDTSKWLEIDLATGVLTTASFYQ